MPYSSVAEVPNYVPKSKRKQWLHVFNSAFKKHGESKAFAMANAVVKKELKEGTVSKALVPDLWEVDKRQVPQDVAEYNAYGATGGKGCATCQWFISPNTCLLVAGDIEPTGKSKFFTPKVEYSTPPLLVKIVSDEMEMEKESGEGGSGILNRVKEWWQAIKSDDAAQTWRPFTVFKDDAGNLRYWLIYSNNYVDKHNQIISEAAHKEYVEWVDTTGEGAYPELQLWHCGPKSAIGKDDFVDYVDGFAVSSGIIYKEHEAIALKLANLDIGVSHGFIGLLPDKKVYTVYRSFERSLLPRDDAANAWTAYAVNSKDNKEVLELPISDKKKAFLKTLGIPDARISEFESGMKDADAALKTLGIEYKEEAAAPAPAAQTPATQAPASASNDILLLMAKELDANKVTVKALQDSITALGAKVDAIAVPVQKQAEQIAADTFEAAVNGGIAAASMASRSNGNVVEDKKEENKDNNWFSNMITGQIAHGLGVGGS